jgi:hypothetical protein
LGQGFWILGKTSGSRWLRREPGWDNESQFQHLCVPFLESVPSNSQENALDVIALEYGRKEHGCRPVKVQYELAVLQVVC